MYRNILIATDGSELAGRAVTAGLGLAKALGARVFPLDDYEKAAAENATRILASVAGEAKDAGVACETVHASDFPAEGIIATARDRHCDLIVMASHGRRGLSKVILGSQASRVLALSAVPVLICR